MSFLFDSPKNLLIYLNVPFSSKETAKKHGLRWSPSLKLWYRQIYIEYINSEDMNIKDLLSIPEELCKFEFKFANFDVNTYDDTLINILELLPYEYEKLRNEILTRSSIRT